MAWVYILRGTRRHYIGATDNLDRLIAEHKRGSNHTTLRFWDHVELVAAKELPSIRKSGRRLSCCVHSDWHFAINSAAIQPLKARALFKIL
jgi:hypothetical protein